MIKAQVSSAGATDAFRDGDAALRARRHVDVRAYPPGLGDQLEAGQLIHQLAIDMGAVADQDDDVRVFQPHRQLAQALDRIRVDLGGIGVEAGCAVELAHRVLVVVENDYVHCVRYICTMVGHRVQEMVDAGVFSAPRAHCR
jgi:hypothetical protein